jgi:iron complex transport system permease protein
MRGAGAIETAGARARAVEQGAGPQVGRFGVAVLALLVACAAGVLVGKATIDPGTALAIVASQLHLSQATPWWPASYESILIEIRLPRVILAALVGAGLSMAGATYQGLFRNPLADPYLVGVAGGAGLGATIAMAAPLPAGFYFMGAVQIAAFLGAMATMVLVYSLARVGRATPITTLLLAGVVVGLLANALTSFIMYSQGDKLTVIYAWLLGGFNVASWQQVALVAPGVGVAAVTLSLLGRIANVMQLDDDQARSLGVNVEMMKLALILGATLSTAAAVSAAGLIGFVGLVVPHFVRMLWGPDHRSLIPLCLLVGATFLVAADTGARLLPGSQDVPVGVVTAFCGAPFFLYLLRQQKRSVF